MSDLIQFNVASGARIGRAVRIVEEMYPRAKPLVFTPIFEPRRGGGGGSPLMYGEFNGDWDLDTETEVDIGEDEPIMVRNEIVSVGADGRAGVYFSYIGNAYYAVSFQLHDLRGNPFGPEPVSGLTHVLGLKDGRLEWIETAVCPEPELPPE